jgi:hypothetical protein
MPEEPIVAAPVIDPRQKCAYCWEPIEPSDLEMRTIISPNWKRTNYRSPLRPYHRSKRCAGTDQMAHEG